MRWCDRWPGLVESGGSPAGSLLKVSLECPKVLTKPGFEGLGGLAYILYFALSACDDINCVSRHTSEGAGTQ